MTRGKGANGETERRARGDGIGGRIPDHSPGIEPVDITCSIAPGIESDGVTDSITRRIITIHQEPHSGPCEPYRRHP